MRKPILVLLSVVGVGLAFVLLRGAAGQSEGAPGAPLSTDAPVGNAFTYQGRLTMDGAPVDGSYDFRFRIFDAPTGGNQVGSTVAVGDVAVNDGLFTVQLDFGAGAFDGQARWLEVGVRDGASDGAYNALAGRQPLTAAPYAVHATEAGTVAWSGLSDVPAGFADGVDDVGLTAITWTDVQNRPPGLDDGDDDTTYAAGAGLALAGATFSAEGSPYGNVLVVAHSGGDFSSVQAALDSIGDASADNPYLIYIAPGVYTETVTLRSYVTLEGSGQGTTIIRALGGSQSPADGNGSATLLGADYATVRHLTVESQGTDQNYAVALHNNAASPALSDVAVRASNGNGNYGIYNSSASPALSDVTVTASGTGTNYGVFNSSSSPDMSRMTTTVSGGFYNRGVYNINSSSPTMRDVTIEASGGTYCFAVVNDNSSPAMTDVTATASDGTYNRSVYNINSSSPTMRDVTVTASGGTYSFAIVNDASSPTMTDVTATASDGTYSRAIFNDSSVSLLMTKVTASASGGNDNYGIYNYASSPAMTDVTATASGGTSSYALYNTVSSYTMTNVIASASAGTYNYGVYNYNSSVMMTNVVASASGGSYNRGVDNHVSSPTIRHSVLEGTTASVSRSGSSGTVKIANTQLIGPVLGSGLTCFNNYDAALDPVICP